MLNFLRFLFPTHVERIISKRYLYLDSRPTDPKSERSSKTKWVLTVLLGILCLAIEAAYFFFFNHSITLAVLSILLPIFFSIFLLLRIFSIYSTVAISGITIGVATLIMVISVVSGFIQEISERINGVNADFFILSRRPFISQENYKNILQQLEKHPLVYAAAPFIQRPMFVSKLGWPPIAVSLQGIDLKESAKIVKINQWLQSTEGASPRIEDLAIRHSQGQGKDSIPSIFLGAPLVRQLNLNVGDKVLLVNPEAIIPGALSTEEETVSVSSQEFYLAGIINIGYEKLDRSIACISFPEAQRLVGIGDVATGVAIRLKSSTNKTKAFESLNRDIIGPTDRYELKDSGMDHMIEALKTQRVGLAMVIFLMILVAAFNVIASLTILVIHKTKSIAIIKTMGIPPWGVAAIFRIVGTKIGIWGTSLGVSLGLLFCFVIRHLHYTLEAKVYLIDHLPVDISPLTLVTTTLLTLLLCSLSTLYPSLRAAYLNPVDGLRQE